MIELEDAIALVEHAAAALPPRRQRLLDACGRTLAAAVTADVDSPPWDRAMMDGFAVRSADFVARVGETVEVDVAIEHQRARDQEVHVPVAAGQQGAVAAVPARRRRIQSILGGRRPGDIEHPVDVGADHLILG
jgi:molybdopterin biosynthesis enzyme